jgi:catalase
MVERIVESVSQTRQDIRSKVYRTFALVSSELSTRVQEGVEGVQISQGPNVQPRL